MIEPSSYNPGRSDLPRRDLLKLTLAAAVLLVVPARARAAESPSQFLDAYANKAVDMLADPATPEEMRVENFEALLGEGFDIRAISQFILGRYWRTATEDEQAEFMRVFKRVLAERYTPIFAGADRSRFSVGEFQQVTGKDGLFMVNTTVVGDDGKLINLRWRVAARDLGYQILDVMVEGVSMVITLRDEYGSVIRQNGIAGLIDRLRQTLKNA